MPEIELQHVVSVSSSDPTHCAENLLRPESYRPWRGARAGERQICVVLQFAREARVQRVEVGNDGSAFVEVLAGAAAAAPGDAFEVLLPAAALLTPAESRAGTGLRRVRVFGPGALAPAAARRPWDRVKVVCSQPYCQTRPFGLSFLRFHSPAESEEPPPAPVRRLGPFTVREEDGGERRPGALFYRRGGPAPPPAAPQEAAGPSYAVATLQASASEAPPGPPRPPKSPAAAKRKLEAAEANGGAEKGAGPKAGRLGPPGLPLAGVVVVLSGFENPLRGRLRDAALALGAGYRPDWTPDSTHLVSAFPRTPKAARARVQGGRVVGPAWIWDCQRQRRRLPCAPYLLEGSGSASSGSEGEEPAEAPPPPRPRRPRKSPPPAEPGPSATPPRADDPPEADAEESGDTEDELRRFLRGQNLLPLRRLRGPRAAPAAALRHGLRRSAGSLHERGGDARGDGAGLGRDLRGGAGREPVALLRAAPLGPGLRRAAPAGATAALRRRPPRLRRVQACRGVSSPRVIACRRVSSRVIASHPVLGRFHRN
ncbi:DNA repair protein XRCC1 isoform X1 [Dromaius novaehollandiae]|uniref:DNA repair protein XRCC1 isoform X1 n=1 Tax=Dromaius novaehollandiae TaxID=8790 RepID=UPI00311E2622